MLRVAFIGTGGISGTHLACLKSLGDVQIAALCDVNEENLRRRRDEYGGEGYTDLRKMLDEAKPHAVWVCTPPTVRRDPLVACAERGIPVFCEKPAERDPERGREIAEALSRLDARVQIGYVFRSLPVVRRLRQEARDDAIHALQSFYGCPMSLKLSSRSWFYDKALSGGALVDQATHNLDLLRYLFGEVAEARGAATNPVHEKKAGYTVEEAFAIGLVFANGTVGSHCHTWVGEAWRNEMAFSGEKRFYRLSLVQGVLTIHEGDETREYRQPPHPIHHYQNEVFLKQVRTGDWSENPSDYADALATLRLTVACDRAVETGEACKP